MRQAVRFRDGRVVFEVFGVRRKKEGDMLLTSREMDSLGVPQ